MGRQRHGKRVLTNSSKDGGDAVSGRKEEKKKDIPNSILHRKEKKKKMDLAKLFINISIGLCIFSLIWFFYALYMRSYLARRIITPHPSMRILDANSTSAAVAPDRFWGSYRPQVYFGMKTRSPRSIVTGLMWMRQFGGADVSLRHTCEQGDRLQSYGWTMHDGVHFGIQEVRDSDFTLTTEFVKRAGGEHGGDWTWRVTAKQQSSAAHAPVISLLFYVAADSQGSLQAHVEEKNRLGSVTGFSEELGHFKLTFRKPAAGEATSAKFASYNYLKTVSPGLEKLTDIVKSSLSGKFIYSPPSGEKRHYIAVDTYRPPPPSHQQQQQRGETRKESDFVVHQVTVQTPFQMEVLFESGSFRDRPNQLVGEVMTEELERRKGAFDAKFEETFELQRKGYTPSQIKFAKAALSNMLGGLGYFHGQSAVQSIYNEYPLVYPEGPLFTAVPSRSFFPRGFLWDEGFHQLLISKWDSQITGEAIAHWLDLMNVEGWIPREQILDDEARSKVPAEFIIQRNENANPPTLFLALQKLVERFAAAAEANESALQGTKAFLRRLFPRLQTWFEWYNTTQAGPLPNSYRWRGRDKDTNLFLNPKTLTSGLDDYPRASHPSQDERHVDLYCWMALASGIMADIAKLIGEPHQEYERTQLILGDNMLLSELHWSEQLKAFSDYGNHTQAVSLQREKVYVPPGQPRHQFPPARLVRAIRKAPKLQYVNALGYVSLFPFLLQLLTPDSPKLEHILKDMRDEQKLWTPYGLRSLSKSDPLYMKRNTEHDAPYWRGPIWININYLAVRALHYYGRTDGPYREKAAALYQELRTNIIENVYRQYMETGYIWEQYNDSTGRGQGSHPFTGWSALCVLMMAEQY
ncbi:mannosyl-oligosaccharide glucosidase [Lepisosteus oculatus]|uniref:mannosyl-oligosaccharide glucosidase n=1 Tax=Lepisosteus oculatus TaxID=7918 RepID=UPI0035F50438